MARTGYGSATDLINALLSTAQAAAPHVFEMTWTGSKIPRGGTVGGHQINWTQNGQVHLEGGSPGSTYERDVEWGGDDGKLHTIRIFTSLESATNPDGTPCKKIK